MLWPSGYPGPLSTEMAACIWQRIGRVSLDYPRIPRTGARQSRDTGSKRPETHRPLWCSRVYRPLDRNRPAFGGLALRSIGAIGLVDQAPIDPELLHRAQGVSWAAQACGNR